MIGFIRPECAFGTILDIEVEYMNFTSKDWMDAIARGNWASADYIASYLPPSDLKGPTDAQRQRCVMNGSIEKEVEE
jgi:hypothetical protein